MTRGWDWILKMKNSRHPLKLTNILYWTIPVGIILVLLFMMYSLLPVRMKASLVSLTHSTFKAESAVVIVPAFDQTGPEGSTSPVTAESFKETTLLPLIKQMESPESQQKLRDKFKNTLKEKKSLADSSLSQYQVHWMADNEYSIRIQTEGADPEALLILADCAAAVLLESQQENITETVHEIKHSPLVASIAAKLEKTEKKLAENRHSLGLLKEHNSHLSHAEQARLSVSLTAQLNHLLQEAKVDYQAKSVENKALMQQLGFKDMNEVKLSELFTNDPVLRQLRDEMTQASLKSKAMAMQFGEDSPEDKAFTKYSELLEENWEKRVGEVVQPFLKNGAKSKKDSPSYRRLASQEMTRVYQLALNAGEIKGQQAKISSLQGQLSGVSKGMSNHAFLNATQARLEREKRQLEREVDFLNALMTSQEESSLPMGNMHGQSHPSGNLIAKIKYPGQLLEQDTFTFTWPAIALFGISLIGVWILKQEKISEATLLEIYPQYHGIEGLDPKTGRSQMNQWAQNHQTALPVAQPAKSKKNWFRPPIPAPHPETLQQRQQALAMAAQSQARQMQYTPAGVATSAQPLQVQQAIRQQRLAEPQVFEEAAQDINEEELEFEFAEFEDDQYIEDFEEEVRPERAANALIRLETPFVEDQLLLKAMANPSVKNGFKSLLGQLAADLPQVMAVFQSPAIASGLAITLAQAGQRTILVDCDSTHPTLHRLFDVPNEWGMTNALDTPASLPKVLASKTDDSPLVILPAGKRLYGNESPSYDNLPVMIETLLSKGDRVILNFPNLADPVAMERIVSLSQCAGLLVCIPEVSLREQAFHLVSDLEQWAPNIPGAWIKLVHWVYTV